MTFSPWTLAIVSTGYLGLLFVIAYLGDRRGRGQRSPGQRPFTYALSLAVYCTSWTFFGNVGSAATSGWTYLPIYLGPMIALLVFAPILRKILVIAKQQNTTSIADFIAARYGKSQALAAVVSAVALLVVLPYIALQLKALTMSFAMLTEGARTADTPSALWADTGLYVAVLMAIFTAAFGTRHVNPRESHQGLIRAIAFESLVKLAAFLAVGLFVVYGLFNGFGDLFRQARGVEQFARVFDAPLIAPQFITTMMLAVGATLCLPRQFHVAVVENTDTRDLRTARWLFPAYLLLMSAFVVPLAAAGLVIFEAGTVAPDRFVLALPMHAEASFIALAAYIGGLSAATGMVIMATVTLATMLCNEIVVPLALRLPSRRLVAPQDIGRTLLRVRRVLIVAILLLAWCCYRLFGELETLATIGLLSFAGVALFLPPLIAGIYLHGVGRRGAMAGIVAGLLVWGYTLMLPNLAQVGWFDDAWIATGPMQLAWLAPQGLFGYDFGDALTHGVFWILAANIATMTVVSLNSTPSLIERAQAVAFVDLGVPRASRARTDSRAPVIRMTELEVLLTRFLGAQAARAALEEYAGHPGDRSRPLRSNQLVDADMLHFAERRLAGVVGSASARLILASGLGTHDFDAGDMVRLIDRTAEAVQFNRNVMQGALENIDQGISVIDQDLRLVAWNKRYLELFEYPPGLVRSGRPVADLIRYNAMRGECGPGPVEEHVSKRLAHMRGGRAHRFERHRSNGTVLQMTGSPMPGGGFVTIFNDITVFKQTEAALTRANERLEARVAERTAALSRANTELKHENEHRAAAQDAAQAARQQAERANLSKTRFLAAASHDLLQPLNAARLFAATAQTDNADNQRAALSHIQSSLTAAQTLLDPLLDISKIDAGAWDIAPTGFELMRVLSPLTTEFSILAADAGLAFRSVESSCWVYSDPTLLRRILQNFLSNAIRYTERGRVLLGVRHGTDSVSIQVWDTGPGIPDDQLDSIFEEFQRGVSQRAAGERGLGLGLSLADRMARLLGHEIDVRSRMGHGTRFAVRVPRAERVAAPSPPDAAGDTTGSLHGCQLLCVDDDPASLTAMTTLLEHWGCDAMTAPADDAPALLADLPIDIAILDYDLGADAPNGLDLAERLNTVRPLPCVLITANRDRMIQARARADGMPVLHKPLEPATLRKTLERLVDARE